MSKTKIEWTETSWNAITGCTKISDGCQNCYAATFAKRLQAMGNPRYANGFEVTIHEDLLEKPLEWKKPQMIFVNSMSDLFHDDVPDEIIVRMFNTMRKASWHTFQVLTKRTERLIRLNNQLDWAPNIWMGTSIENSSYLFRRDDLIATQANIKFISAEPLIGTLTNLNLDGIDWLIVGGESGANSRPISEEWVIELQQKAQLSNTAFFFNL